MNQQVFATIVTSVMSTYFGVLILMYVLRTFLAWVLNESPGDLGFTSASSSEVKVKPWTDVAIQAEILAD